MDIDRDAPALAHERMHVSAPPVLVWEVLADVEGWPSWNRAIASARLEGTLAPGTEFRWKAGPGAITSRLEEVERPRRLAWTGRTLGIRAVHVYALEPSGEGTEVTSEESWDGLAVRLLRGRLQRALAASLRDGLAALRAEAERRATA